MHLFNFELFAFFTTNVKTESFERKSFFSYKMKILYITEDSQEIIVLTVHG